MKKIMLYMAALMPLAFASCLNDEGNYDYTELQTVEISGLPDQVRCVLLEDQNIVPQVKTAIPESQLEFIWRVGADTLCLTKALNYKFTEVPIGSDPLTFEVRDTKTNVRYAKYIDLTVVSPFTTGYAILTDNGKLFFQSFEAGNTLYKDLYKEVNGESLTGTPMAVKQLRYQDGSTGAWGDRISVTMKGGKSPELDGLSMKLCKFYDDEFHTSTVPSLSYVTAQYYAADKALDIITSDGQVYLKRVGSMGLPDDGYYEYPLVSSNATYRLAPCLARVTSNDADYIGFDEQNHCFVMWMGTNLSSVITPMNLGAEYANIPGRLVWIGCPLYNSTAYAIVDNGGKYMLYVMSYGYSYDVWDYVSTMEAAVELPAGTVSNNSVFAANIVMSGYDVTTNYLFVGDGPNLKAINLVNLSNIDDAIVDVATFDGDITDMHFDRDVNVLPTPEFSIAVSRASGSSVMQIDPTLVNKGAVLRRFDGIEGRIVSFCRKL